MTLSYTQKRLLTIIPLLIGITFISFLIMKLAPGDAASMFKNPNIPVEDILQLRQNWGLDQPIYTQYWKWLVNLCHGNLGYSYMTGQSVGAIILERLPATLLLSLSSFISILVITFFLGLWSGYKQGTIWDDMISFFSFLGMSVPSFWLGMIFILLFSVTLNWVPSSGYMDPWLSDAPFMLQMTNIMAHMWLPFLTTVVGGIAGLTRYHRSGIITILTQPYIQAARARGFGPKRILFKHAFKNACLPIITILGLSIPGLISGSFIIEYIFAWPGMGQLGINAVFARDYPVIMGTLLFSSCLIILGNLLADLAIAKIDPRISSPS